MEDPDKPSCVTCREMYKKRELKGNKNCIPPCAECIPALHHSNEEPLEVYNLVRDQQRFPPMGGSPISLEQTAIHKAMEVLDIEDKKSCLEKVVRAYRESLAKVRERTELNKKE